MVNSTRTLPQPGNTILTVHMIQCQDARQGGQGQVRVHDHDHHETQGNKGTSVVVVVVELRQRRQTDNHLKTTLEEATQFP